MVVLVFGDSITWGAWDPKGGWVARLRKLLDKEIIARDDFYQPLYNLGISGNNTEKLLKRFEFEAEQRPPEEEKETVVIIAIGTNDASFFKKENSFKVPSDKFRENINKLVDRAEKFADKIVFVGLFPVDEAKTAPRPHDRNRFYRNEDLERYNAVIRGVAIERAVGFVEIFDIVRKLKYKDMLEDGLHPNSKGHEEIFELVKDYLLKNGIIKL